ncbi:hypothetical protein HYPSUDRAFT_783965 [Hypholoma sublateritium FD-334 SS-4]|uniref:Uncharacterized protein n=1 Tax=Hypholoma sublateritium (strain FD-334 SS-4) TaxID=945553 RepID=A0A0D2NVZ4_HYPSF|nr:hypothetical protein HYPSUDRAFT_783965 [Hypholoma sublateritium FD-334 SS-4]
MAYTESIEHAARFLTRPLILAVAPACVAALQVVLRSTLHAACSSAPLVLPFAPNRLPPRPVYAAAIGAGVSWADWMALYAPREFALVITPRAVRAEYAGLHPHTVLIWADRTALPAHGPITKLAPAARPAAVEEQVPISKLGRRLQATVASARARAQTRTLAQRLLDATHDADADELFARLARSHAGILSPSPTCAAFTFPHAPAAPRQVFGAFTSPLSARAPRTPSPATSSRPSSRSSVFSTGAESVSSASSVDECDTVEVKPAAAPAAREFVAPRPPLAPFHGSRPAHVQAPAPAFVEEPESALVVVDASKKEVTKYLYQGGVSTVLTGGVMLGAAAASNPPPTHAATPHYRVPVAARAPRHTHNVALNVGSWRRVAACA